MHMIAAILTNSTLKRPDRPTPLGRFRSPVPLLVFTGGASPSETPPPFSYTLTCSLDLVIQNLVTFGSKLSARKAGFLSFLYFFTSYHQWLLQKPLKSYFLLQNHCAGKNELPQYNSVN